MAEEQCGETKQAVTATRYASHDKASTDHRSPNKDINPVACCRRRAKLEQSSIVCCRSSLHLTPTIIREFVAMSSDAASSPDFAMHSSAASSPSAASRVFELYDIASLILHRARRQFGNSSVLPFTIANKTIGDIALDVLWERQTSLLPLFMVLRHGFKAETNTRLVLKPAKDRRNNEDIEESEDHVRRPIQCVFVALTNSHADCFRAEAQILVRTK